MDHAATSPLRPAAKDALVASWDLLNPGGQYKSGRDARRALEEAREQIAELLGAEPIEVIFTASGTEADNLAVHGLYHSHASENRRGVLVGSVEHPAVLEPAQALAGAGAQVRTLPVDSSGHYVGKDCNLTDSDCLVAVQWANNESGAIQPLAEIGQQCAEAGVAWHVDAVQAVGHVPVDFHACGASTLAASAHKFGGPRSTGLLLCRRTETLVPLLRGGGQERSIRPGTVNVAGAVATAAALADACATMETEYARISALRDELLAVVRAGAPDVQVHTAQPALPGHLHFSVPGCEGDSLIMLLDAAGFDCSTGSACAAGVNRVSHVVMAMGVDPQVARGTLRLTLGSASTEESVREFAAHWERIVAQARAAGMA